MSGKTSLILLGPSLPKTLVAHSMVTLDRDLVAIGGSDGSTYQSSLYLMACQNKVCEWQIVTQKLKVGRGYFVAMLIPDELAAVSYTHLRAHET